jgi:hypothetical protein
MGRTPDTGSIPPLEIPKTYRPNYCELRDQKACTGC